MKKILMYSAICICLFSITGNSIFAQEFIDDRFGYSIKHPFTWKVTTCSSGVVAAYINSPDKKSGLQVLIHKSKTPIERFVRGYIIDFEKSMKATSLYQGTGMYGPFRGYWVTFHLSKGGVQFFFKSFIIPIDGPRSRDSSSRVFVLQSGLPFAQRASGEMILDSIANSFRLAPTANSFQTR